MFFLKNLPPPPPDFIQVNNPVSHENLNSDDKKTGRKLKASPLAFGAFRCAMDLRKKILDTHVDEKTRNELNTLLREALHLLAAGYFEYSRPLKVDLYRRSREILSRLWVELEFIQMNQANLKGLEKIDVSSLSHFLLQEMLPILSGTLKKIERANERKA
jgi:hypothetical protein